METGPPLFSSYFLSFSPLIDRIAVFLAIRGKSSASGGQAALSEGQKLENNPKKVKILPE
ncbi:MAG: hypothetical protein LBK64_07345 [Spirochaetaceae bacterium]|nr:hypothetical protein [Spirochaetaceae bacterium]